MPTPPLINTCAGLPNPRRGTRNEFHTLVDILTVATCAVIGGAETWEAIAEHGRTKEAFLRQCVTLDDALPSAGTFGRVFAKLDLAAFAKACGSWMAASCEATGTTRRRYLPKCNKAPQGRLGQRL